MPNYVLGLNAKAYRSSTLLDGTNTVTVLADAGSVEMRNIRDLTANADKAEADITTRDNNGWRQTVGTLKDGSVEFQMLHIPGDADFEAIRDAWLDDEEIALFFLDQEKTASGAQGLASNFNVTGFSRSEELENALLYTITVRTSSFSEWHEVA